MIEILLNSLS